MNQPNHNQQPGTDPRREVNQRELAHLLHTAAQLKPYTYTPTPEEQKEFEYERPGIDWHGEFTVEDTAVFVTLVESKSEDGQPQEGRIVTCKIEVMSRSAFDGEPGPYVEEMFEVNVDENDGGLWGDYKVTACQVDHDGNRTVSPTAIGRAIIKIQDDESISAEDRHDIIGDLYEDSIRKADELQELTGITPEGFSYRRYVQVYNWLEDIISEEAALSAQADREFLDELGIKPS